MPSETGGETIGERLKRLRTELTRVRETVARHENNGAANNIGGSSITEIAYEQALARTARLESQIAGLEARLAGSAVRQGIAQLQVKLD
jgi:hypothetical protein